jgi:hypothetical protein
MIDLDPHDRTLIQSIFTEIRDSGWFRRNAVTEWELLKLILREHSLEGWDEDELAERCRQLAHKRFS